MWNLYLTNKYARLIFFTLLRYAPLLRDGRMEKFYWAPDRDDITEMVARMFEGDTGGLSKEEVSI